MPKAFAFRLKPSRIDRVEELLNDSQIAIGWSNAQKLVNPSLDKPAFRIELDTQYPDLAKRGRLGHDTNHVWRFIREVSVGDVVIVPHGDNVHFLEVTSGPKLLPGKIADDTAIRRDVSPLLDGKPLSRRSLPSELRKALSFRDTSKELSSVLKDVLAITKVTQGSKAPLIAVESRAGIAAGIQRWQKAFEQLHTPHEFSDDLLWIADVGIWLLVRGWDRDGEHRYWNGLGNRLGNRSTRNLIVEVNPPDGGKPGRWQGLVAETSDGQTWLLHSGEMKVQGKGIQLRDHVTADQLATFTVRFTDGTLESYFAVARLDTDPLDVVIQTKRFMDVCLQVRTQQLGADPAFVQAQRKANLFEESIGHSVVPPQGAKLIDRVHAKIWHSLRKELERKGFKVSNERVGSLGPDLFTTEHETPYLFEIKTTAGASDYLKAVGQLTVYEKALGKTHRKFLVIPPGMDEIASRILDELDIEVIEFSQQGSGYAFAWPDEL
ncbi:hypothetical protein PZB21_25885 [Rhizobium sp. CBK13]|uniref:hypothetical protein n=1 Tax=Rhizobium sp. CBK13 TaxID=3031399 RepID=UPI0023B1CB8F|nr:hypothetical protein [Rhizobium sp. CBK13]MDE8762606.1 hypothetical protein [Rhizobium sp. CBK13]